jgi:hypothetical protein
MVEKVGLTGRFHKPGLRGYLSSQKEHAKTDKRKSAPRGQGFVRLDAGGGNDGKGVCIPQRPLGSTLPLGATKEFGAS